MKVIATKPGYFGKLRAAGDEFEVPDGARATWFTSATAHASKAPAKTGKDQDKAPAKTGAD